VKPYWSDETCALYVGDCREILPALGITADCVIADPPYESTSLEWDRWPDGWLEAAAGVSRSMWCFLPRRQFVEPPFRGREFWEAGWRFSHPAIWEKHNGPSFVADRLKQVHEEIGHWYQGPWADVYHEVPRVPQTSGHAPGKIRNRAANRTPHTGDIGGSSYDYGDDRLARSVIYARSMHHEAIHRTQKPVPVLLPLISYACPSAGLVIDPFGGSCSTLMACRETGRRGIAIEADEAHCERAAEWLSTPFQPDLFGGAA
jgi:site-specific DNA-methyltransferase (adenine-specific)